jgi:hypothetical protein
MTKCLFIRVLQSYEATFAYAAIELAAAAAEIARGDGAAAVAALSGTHAERSVATVLADWHDAAGGIP